MHENTALLLIDIQNGFMPDGELPVADGDAVVAVANRLMPDYPLVVASQDWHPADHGSFAANHPGRQPFEQINLNGLPQTLWPVHCIAGSRSAELHPGLDQHRIAAVFRKGMDAGVDSYSAFYDNGRRCSTGLTGYLKACGIQHLHIIGLAADYCVHYTIQDALDEGFNVGLILSGTRAISTDRHQTQLQVLRRHPRFSVIA